MNKESLRVVIAGGGTGGHVLPALVIAKTLQDLRPGIQIDFVGTQRGIESKIVPRAGYPLHLLEITGLKGAGIKGLIWGLLRIPKALFQSFVLLRHLRPDAVLGVGGYASGPLVLSAAVSRIPTAIWEPNAFPGLTNRILGRFVKRIYCVYSTAKAFFPSARTVESGMPLREGIEPRPRPAHSRLRVLVFGGSQGAKGINDAVSQAVEKGGAWQEQIELVHQTGEAHWQSVRNRYQSAPNRFEVQAFLHDMAERYAWADLIFCRAGAGTVAELAAARKAAVLVPFPFAADNHQQHNAEALAKKGAAVMVLQKDFNSDRFIQLIEHFIRHKEEIQSLQERIAVFHQPHSADQIAKDLLNFAR